MLQPPALSSLSMAPLSRLANPVAGGQRLPQPPGGGRSERRCGSPDRRSGPADPGPRAFSASRRLRRKASYRSDNPPSAGCGPGRPPVPAVPPSACRQRSGTASGPPGPLRLPPSRSSGPVRLASRADRLPAPSSRSTSACSLSQACRSCLPPGGTATPAAAKSPAGSSRRRAANSSCRRASLAAGLSGARSSSLLLVVRSSFFTRLI